MTVVVAFFCVDGIVIAADSMLTSSIGSLPIGHHKGRKVHVVSGPQIGAYAGDLGLGARFRTLADDSSSEINNFKTPLDYTLAITGFLKRQFENSGASIDHVNGVLGFGHLNHHFCTVFQAGFQPFVMDQDHYYVAIGSGKLAADPFLRFLVDTFCTCQPSVREGIFLATWAVQHVIDTNPGGVAGPIKLASLEYGPAGPVIARELEQDTIDEHLQAVRSAQDELRAWRNRIAMGGVI